MKNKLTNYTSPQHGINTMLAAGANVSPRNEAHGLEGFGHAMNVRPESWCAGLTHFCARVVSFMILVKLSNWCRWMSSFFFTSSSSRFVLSVNLIPQ